MTAKADRRWSRLPNAWIYEKGLRALSAGPRSRGGSSAALKLFVTLALRAENKAAVAAELTQGSASLSYDDLMSLTNLSRAQIAKGIKLLTEQKLIVVKADGRGRRSRYFLTRYGSSDTFGKIPNQPLFRSPAGDRVRTLQDLSCRNESDVNAMKLYLFLCGTRDQSAHRTLASYETIHEVTGIPESKIRKAISVLIDRGLIRVDREREDDATQNQPNKYYVLGL